MNVTAFFLALAVSLGYYFYTVRRERAKQEKDHKE